ncbi:putative F-box domain-containing protein [Medicago truncatula]|uniref:F-box protein interaction domain protein n=1 Tax=Medicago truncatula TaxID=3880 RepID=A0A072VJ42_MEDTR|nr:F-box/kelch-repeat protein At3g23880 [Medicago truncatula]KEH41428.1 F-box protein interaction domain protein [Medicago truncatula]RHN78942.1 putative F-box domain-containing protein [Medicago truncatula]
MADDDDDEMKTGECKITDLSCIRLHHSQNHTVFSQPLSETTVKNEQPLPPTGDEAPILPEEVLFDILLRLPVRSLLQLKLVCKSWKTLISNSQFTKTHLLTSSTAYPQLFSGDDREIVCYAVKPLLENPSTLVQPVTIGMTHRYGILGSCNGLLCLYDDSQSNFRLWNPLINLKSDTFPIVASFDKKLVTYHGFGYDQVNDKYKLLLFVHNQDDFTERITRIYTFGENSWTTLQNFPSYPSMWSGKFVSGTLNWIVSKNAVNSNQRVILSVDLEKETYGELLLPQHDGYRVCDPIMYVLSNCLCVCSDNHSETHLAVWIMKEYGVAESWTILTIISHEKLFWGRPRHPIVEPLFVSKDGVLLLRTMRSKLVLCNLNNGGVDYPRTSDILGTGRELHIYYESLVSPF